MCFYFLYFFYFYSFCLSWNNKNIEYIMNKQKNIVIIVSSAFLLLAGFSGWPYDFFVLLRFVVCLSTSYLAWLASNEKQEKWLWVYSIIAILFNPFLPIHLTRSSWVVIDFATAIFLIISKFTFRLKK